MAKTDKPKKKYPAPKGSELKLERPIRIKTAEIKRQFKKLTSTERAYPIKEVGKRLIADHKVSSAFKVGKKSKKK